MAQSEDAIRPKLHVLYTCPFCWKVRGLVEHLGLDVDYVSVNGMRIKKDVAFAGDWGKVPVFTDESGEHFSYQIVGDYESDIKNKKLSVSSPLARGLINKTIDDVVEISSPKGQKSYTIKSIKYV